MNDFERVLGAALRAAGGERLPGVTLDSIVEPGMCAQHARQTVEAGAGMQPGTWPVAALATTYQRKRGGSVRWASDYAAAARELGLELTQAVPGCLLYWDYSWRDPKTGRVYPFGHIAINLGTFAGVQGPAMLENSNAAARAGGLRPFGTLGGRLSHVYVAPQSVMGKPALMFAPTAAALAALRSGQPEPAGEPGKAQVFLSRNGAPWVDVSGQRLELPRLTVNAKNPGKVYIRTEEQA